MSSALYKATQLLGQYTFYLTRIGLDKTGHKVYGTGHLVM
mgnify:CR=1 FL=1